MRHRWFQSILIAVCVALSACGGERAVKRVSTSDLPAPTPAPAAVNAALAAMTAVGAPYRYGGNNPTEGFDCSGLVAYAYAQGAGIPLPRTVPDLSRMGLPIANTRAPTTGDVLLFSDEDDGESATHVGIYVGDGRFVHAPKTGGVVRIDALDERHWHARYLGARRVLPAALP